MFLANVPFSLQIFYFWHKWVFSVALETALAAVVFQNAAAMQRLERIVHPAVRVALIEELATLGPSSIAVIDAIKLLEGSSGALCQSKWLVLCKEEQELARLMDRNHLSYDEAQARIRAQPDVASKMPLVDELIDNSGSLRETRRQVEAAFQRFCRRFPL